PESAPMTRSTRPRATFDSTCSVTSPRPTPNPPRNATRGAMTLPSATSAPRRTSGSTSPSDPHPGGRTRGPAPRLPGKPRDSRRTLMGLFTCRTTAPAPQQPPVIALTGTDIDQITASVRRASRQATIEVLHGTVQVRDLMAGMIGDRLSTSGYVLNRPDPYALT